VFGVSAVAIFSSEMRNIKILPSDEALNRVLKSEVVASAVT